MSDIRDEMDLVYQSILARCRVGSTESAAVRPRGDEMLLAVSITTGQAVVVHKRRYGAQPGTRTVILTMGDQSSHYELMLDRFAPTPIETTPRDTSPVLDRYARRTGGIVPPPAVIETTAPAGREMPYVPPAPSYRLHDGQYHEIARGDDETWARRMAASMAEFDVCLVCMFDGETRVIQHNSYTRRIESIGSAS